MKATVGAVKSYERDSLQLSAQQLLYSNKADVIALLVECHELF